MRREAEDRNAAPAAGLILVLILVLSAVDVSRRCTPNTPSTDVQDPLSMVAVAYSMFAFSDSPVRTWHGISTGDLPRVGLHLPALAVVPWLDAEGG